MDDEDVIVEFILYYLDQESAISFYPGPLPVPQLLGWSYLHMGVSDLEFNPPLGSAVQLDLNIWNPWRGRRAFDAVNMAEGAEPDFEFVSPELLFL